MISKIVTSLNNGESLTDTTVDIYTIKDNAVIKYNGEPIGNYISATEQYKITQEDLEKIKPYAEQVKNGDISYEEYRTIVEEEGIRACQ